LADIADFIEAKKLNINNPLSKNNWLIAGGGYSGAVAAWFKRIYPDHVKAAWSSSGFINAI